MRLSKRNRTTVLYTREPPLGVLFMLFKRSLFHFPIFLPRAKLFLGGEAASSRLLLPDAVKMEVLEAFVSQLLTCPW